MNKNKKLPHEPIDEDGLVLKEAVVCEYTVPGASLRAILDSCIDDMDQKSYVWYDLFVRHDGDGFKVIFNKGFAE